jgi:osmotically inducible protein OsmC
VPGITGERFVALAEQAKATCPISLALAGTEITVQASLE